MRATFKLGKVESNSDYTPYQGEVLLRQKTDGTTETLVGDGKTPAKDLFPLISYDLQTRVWNLEQEVKELKKLIEKK